jgi:hypothetical protein
VDKESFLVAYKLCHFQFIFGLQKSKWKYKAFLMNMAKGWATDKMVAAEPESDTDLVRPGPLTTAPRRPHQLLV